MRIRLLAASAVAVLAVAACSGGATPSPAGSPSAAASQPPASSAAASQVTGDATVTVVESDLGPILADAEGRVLYGFTPDTEGDSTCYDACAEAWPPLLAEGDPAAGEGVTATLSTTTRTDGGTQVKAGDWPLYYFAGDQNPGDTNGQGVQDVWFVVSPAGELMQDAEAAVPYEY